jgi:S-DNA-T family DNA segregation ATPase FtsK/SpoIIIE
MSTQPLPDYEPTSDLPNYRCPTLDLLVEQSGESEGERSAALEARKRQIIGTLMNFDVGISRISATVGPTLTLYEIVPAAGVRVSRIKHLEGEIALGLSASSMRLIAPMPGKGTIGIEVPNEVRRTLPIRSLLEAGEFQRSPFDLPVSIGKTSDNRTVILDLATLPHLLIGGATGEGKSAALHAIIISLLYKKHPSQLKFVLIDEHQVELGLYRSIQRHFLAMLPGTSEGIVSLSQKAVETLNSLCVEMNNRYDLLREANARNCREYNDKFVKRRLDPQKGHQYLPYILLLIDDIAALIQSAGAEIVAPLIQLAEKAHVAGIHVVIASSIPSPKILTRDLKPNFPARALFKVTSREESKAILDETGGERLLGMGDMLLSVEGRITRLQCAFVETAEVERVTAFIGTQRGYPEAFKLPDYIAEADLTSKDPDLADRDPLFEEAARLVVIHQLGSTALIQRKMKLGYNRAGRLMDQLEAAGIVGPGVGSAPRDVLIRSEMELDQYLDL